MRLVPDGEDWPDDPSFQDLLLHEIAQEIESAIHRRVQSLTPGRPPQQIAEAYRVRVTGDGQLEIHEVTPGSDALIGVPPAKQSIPSTTQSTSSGLHEDPIRVGIREGLEKVPTAALKVRKQIRSRNPSLAGPSPEVSGDILQP